jgi:hypothetical protein
MIPQAVGPGGSQTAGFTAGFVANRNSTDKLTDSPIHRAQRNRNQI